MKDKLDNLIKKIQQMSELFYQQKNVEGFEYLDQVLEELIQSMNELYNYKFEDNSMECDKIEINDILIRIMKAMEIKDTVLIADIFFHELSVILKRMRDA